MSELGSELINKLVLDGTKVLWHRDRIEKWQRGEKFAPITIDCAMTRACNYACDFCYAQLQANESEGKVTKEHFCDFLTDAAEAGVLGVSFISDGESTVVPWWADAVEHAASVGLKVGAGSNGYKLTRPVLERTLKHLSYLRFNFSAGTPKRYAAIMGVPHEWFHQVIQNVRDAMEIVNRDGLKTTVNLQMVLNPKDGDQIIPFAKLVAETRPSYGIIKHCSEGDDGQLGVDYEKYKDLEDDLHLAEEIGREAGVRLVVKWNRINAKLQRSYTRCMAPPFQLQVSGTGLVAPCGLKFNSKFGALHIGNITKTRFRDILNSERYWEVMRYIASDEFNPQCRCAPGCLQDHTNAALFEYQEGRVTLPVGENPPHMEFV